MLGFSDHYTAQSNHDVLKLINLHSLIFKGAIVSVQAVNEMKRCSVSVYSMKWKVIFTWSHVEVCEVRRVRHHQDQPRAILSPPSPITSPYKHSTQHNIPTMTITSIPSAVSTHRHGAVCSSESP